ncbi:hypothetical protein D3C81_1698680 [compost metagenome]
MGKQGFGQYGNLVVTKQSFFESPLFSILAYRNEFFCIPSKRLDKFIYKAGVILRIYSQAVTWFILKARSFKRELNMTSLPV